MDATTLAEKTRLAMQLGGWPMDMFHIMERCIKELPAFECGMVPHGDYASCTFHIETPSLPAGWALLEWRISTKEGGDPQFEHYSDVDDARITAWLEQQRAVLQDLSKTFAGSSGRTLN